MANVQDPNPKKGTLKAGTFSWMNFMKEELEYDLETDSLVRFRGIFIAPDWSGVEENEIDYIVDDPHMRLDKLAALVWGSGRDYLWWVIAARNEMDIPVAELYQGRKLKIPSWQWVNDMLLPQYRTLTGSSL